MIVGFAIVALGIVMMLRAEVGLAPWDVLHQGVADRLGVRFGTANVLVGLVVVGVVAVLGSRREIGWATLANMTLIGLFINAILELDPVGDLGGQPYALRLLVAVAGTAVAGVGFALYIAAGFGAGPRDGLMLLLARRTGLRIALARNGLELTVLALGVALGGTAGLGTVVFALGIGPAIEAVLVLLARSGVAAPQAAPEPAIP
jgi:uncharacterized membrane protein YczE